MQLYPHWNARDNYRYGAKKKKRKRDKSDDPGAPRAVEDLLPASQVGRGASLLFSSLLILDFVLVAPTEQGGASKVLRPGQG